jgi:hypothetical protein
MPSNDFRLLVQGAVPILPRRGQHRADRGNRGADMEGIAAIIVNAIAGMVGGGVAGNLVKTAGLALLPKLLSGAVGGVIGGAALGSMFGGAPVDPAAATAAAGGIDWGTLIAQLIGGGAGGGILTAIVGSVMGRK